MFTVVKLLFCNPFRHFQQVSRYVSYRDPSIAIRIVSWGYRIVTPLIINDLTLPGFELKHLNRLGKRGGVLCVLHRNSLKFVRTAAVTPTHFELLQLSCSKPCYHFALIYKPPASSVPGFLDEFEDLVSSLVTA